MRFVNIPLGSLKTGLALFLGCGSGLNLPYGYKATGRDSDGFPPRITYRDYSAKLLHTCFLCNRRQMRRKGPSGMASADHLLGPRTVS